LRADFGVSNICPSGPRWWAPILTWQGIAPIGWVLVALTLIEEPGLRVPALLYSKRPRDYR